MLLIGVMISLFYLSLKNESILRLGNDLILFISVIDEEDF